MIPGPAREHAFNWRCWGKIFPKAPGEKDISEGACEKDISEGAREKDISEGVCEKNYPRLLGKSSFM